MNNTAYQKGVKVLVEIEVAVLQLGHHQGRRQLGSVFQKELQGLLLHVYIIKDYKRPKSMSHQTYPI